jgi:hypothetical protein
MLFLRRAIRDINLSYIFVSVTKIFFATILTGIVLNYFVNYFSGTIQKGVFTDLILIGSALSFLGVALYALSNLALNNRQLFSALRGFRRQKWNGF